MERIKVLIQSLYAGLSIGLGCIINLVMISKEQSTIGAFLFGFGLFIVITFQFKLYTGQIGYLPKHLLLILLGNLIGIIVTGQIVNFTKLSYITSYAKEICVAKLSDSYLSQLILSIFCGILMFIAVEGKKRLSSNPSGATLIVFLSIAIFILCGFEHCIAAAGYFAIAQIFNIEICLRILNMVLGNSIGTLVLALPILKFLEKVK